MKALLGLLTVGHAPVTLAHQGHGLSGVHWHASDTLGFVMLAVIVAAALWAAHRQ